MEQDDKRDWIKRLEARRDQEIQAMFAANSDSNRIDDDDLSRLQEQTIDIDKYMLIEMLNKKYDARRKQQERKKRIPIKES